MLVSQSLEKIVNDDDPETPLGYTALMEGNNLIFQKDKSLDSTPSMTLKLGDGIRAISYNRRAPAVYARVTGANNTWGEFQYGNAPMGVAGLRFSDSSLKSNAECADFARKKVMEQFEEIDEIRIDVSKGYWISPGSVVRVEVPNSAISGAHRVMSKKDYGRHREL